MGVTPKIVSCLRMVVSQELAKRDGEPARNERRASTSSDGQPETERDVPGEQYSAGARFRQLAGWKDGAKINALGGAIIRGYVRWQAHNQCALVGMD